MTLWVVLRPFSPVSTMRYPPASDFAAISLNVMSGGVSLGISAAMAGAYRRTQSAANRMIFIALPLR